MEANIVQAPKFYKITRSQFFKIIGITFCIVFFPFVYAFAAEPGLTTIFTTRAFQGSWEIINEWNIVGKVMNWIISTYSLFGLCLSFYQTLVSLLFLSSPNLWRTVHDVKKTNQGNFFGFVELAKSTFNTTRGTGFDAILTFVYGLLPDIMEYSDYAEGKELEGLSQEDNALQYILRTAPQRILIIFFFSLGFAGLLGQLYGTVVDGMVAFADNAVKINFAAYVDKFFQDGKNYRFHLSDQGTEMGQVQQAVAKRVYQQAVVQGHILDEQVKKQMGEYIQSQVGTGVTDAKLQAVLASKPGTKITDKEWGSVSPSVSLVTGNGLKSNINLTIPMGQFVHGARGEQYNAVVNLVPDRTAVNYFQ